MSVVTLMRWHAELKREETGSRAALLNSSGRGRPSYQISREQLVYFLRERFSRREVADMLRVSLSTVARRIREHGLVNLLPYSTISDEDLDGVVRDVQALFPNIGYRGIVIQHARIRASMIRTEPEGAVLNPFPHFPLVVNKKLIFRRRT